MTDVHFNSIRRTRFLSRDQYQVSIKNDGEISWSIREGWEEIAPFLKNCALTLKLSH